MKIALITTRPYKGICQIDALDDLTTLHVQHMWMSNKCYNLLKRDKQNLCGVAETIPMQQTYRCL